MLPRFILLAISLFYLGSMSFAASSEQPIQLAQADTSPAAPEKAPAKALEEAEPVAEDVTEDAAEDDDATESGNYDEEDDGIVYTKEVSADQQIDFPVDI